MPTAIAATPRELLRIRRDTDATFDKAVEVWRPSFASNGAGGRTESFSRNSAGPGRIAPLSNRDAEQVYADRLGGRAGYVITVAHDRNLALKDQLRLDGRTFEIVSIDAPRSYSVDRRVVVAEVT